MSVLHTTIDIGSGLADYDVPIRIEYTYHRARSQTSVDPAEPAYCVIEDVYVTGSSGREYPAPWLCDLLAEDEEMLSLCLLDHDEQAHAAEEYRADAIREERALREAGL